jgi:hypothetical protein
MNTGNAGAYQKYFDSIADWDIWLTVTFRQAVSTERAFKIFKYFFKTLNTVEFQFFKKYIRCIVLSERHESRPSDHIHCLIKGISPSLAGPLERRCRDFFGRSEARAYNPNLPRLASGYMARKCENSKAEDWGIIKINSRWRESRRSQHKPQGAD